MAFYINHQTAFIIMNVRLGCNHSPVCCNVTFRASYRDLSEQSCLRASIIINKLAEKSNESHQNKHACVKGNQLVTYIDN